jgi:hypothetical protein
MGGVLECDGFDMVLRLPHGKQSAIGIVDRGDRLIR